MIRFKLFVTYKDGVMVPYDSETAPEWHISGRLLLFTAPRGERWALGLAEVKSVRILEVDAPSV